MYDLDVFEEMKKQIIYEDDSFEIPKPEAGGLDLSELKNSDYFFC